MLLISDLHLRDETADTVLGQVLPGIREAAHEHGVSDIGILGDVFHIRYRVSVRLLNSLRDAFAAWGAERLNVRIIPGNHDQIDVEGRNALETLGDLPCVQVYSQPTWDPYGLWFPYRKPELFVSELERMIAVRPFEGLIGTLFCHQGFRGAMVNDGYVDEDGIPLALLDPFDNVMCGHYHKRQQVGSRLTYVGSAYQVSAGESGQRKGYHLWKEHRLTFFERDWGRKYHRAALAAGETLDTHGLGKDDDIRLQTETVEDAERIGRMLTELGYTHHTVTPKVTAVESRIKPQNESLESYARAYADKVAPPDLDRLTLQAVFEEITNG